MNPPPRTFRHRVRSHPGFRSCLTGCPEPLTHRHLVETPRPPSRNLARCRPALLHLHRPPVRLSFSAARIICNIFVGSSSKKCRGNCGRLLRNRAPLGPSVCAGNLNFRPTEEILGDVSITISFTLNAGFPSAEQQDFNCYSASEVALNFRSLGNARTKRGILSLRFFAVNHNVERSECWRWAAGAPIVNKQLRRKLRLSRQPIPEHAPPAKS